jgi:hypothetical protein
VEDFNRSCANVIEEIEGQVEADCGKSRHIEIGMTSSGGERKILLQSHWCCVSSTRLS